MNPETGSFAGCMKHPSQFFTGFCSSCLVERLSNVDSVESIKIPSCREILEISESVVDSQRKNDGAKMRRTLLSLFEFDDLKELEKMGGSACHNVCCGESSEICQPVVDFELERDGFDGEKSFRLRSKLLMRRLKWRGGRSFKKGQMPEKCLSTGIDSTKVGTFSNWMDSGDASKVCLEKPRHSWDGSMMSKALACSFSCLEEQEDGAGEIKETIHDEAANSDLESSSGANDVGKVKNGILSCHNSFSADGSFGEQHCQDIAVSGVCRKKSNRWGRVWDWSITSPFRDFAKRNGHALERSLSESWRDNHRDNNAKNLNGDIVAADVNRQGQKPELQKMRDFNLSRSHSVRYSSPRNLDNGLLRFYLTPLRTSRRNTAKGRRRTPHSLARGFLGP